MVSGGGWSWWILCGEFDCESGACEYVVYFAGFLFGLSWPGIPCGACVVEARRQFQVRVCKETEERFLVVLVDLSVNFAPVLSNQAFEGVGLHVTVPTAKGKRPWGGSLHLSKICCELLDRVLKGGVTMSGVWW